MYWTKEVATAGHTIIYGSLPGVWGLKQTDDGRMERRSRERALSTDHTAERKIEREIHRDTAMKTIARFKCRVPRGEGKGKETSSAIS